MEGLRSCDRKSRELQVGITEDISPKVWKTTWRHLSKKWVEAGGDRDHCPVGEPKKTTWRGMPVRNDKQQQQKNYKITPQNLSE